MMEPFFGCRRRRGEDERNVILIAIYLFSSLQTNYSKLKLNIKIIRLTNSCHILDLQYSYFFIVSTDKLA